MVWDQSVLPWTPFWLTWPSILMSNKVRCITLTHTQTQTHARTHTPLPACYLCKTWKPVWFFFNFVLKDKCGSVLIYIDHSSTKTKLEIDKSWALTWQDPRCRLCPWYSPAHNTVYKYKPPTNNDNANNYLMLIARWGWHYSYSGLASSGFQ